MKVKPYLDKGELAMVPDKLVRGIVLQRLQQVRAAHPASTPAAAPAV